MLYLENAVNSLIALAPDKFNYEIALAIIDMLVLESSHYMKVEDTQKLLVSVRNLISEHLDEQEEAE